ncbi:transporter, major facilitator family protein [Bordetella holmesii CDC-H785-BH]|nr:transporter, major facilitator family protein [Bordetella holmesii CDC-H785-BH]
MVGLSFAAGPTLASLILVYGSWHWLFLINVPVGVVALVLALRGLPATARSGHRFEWRAGLLCAGFLSFLVLGLTEAGHYVPVWRVASELAIAAFCLVLLLYRQAGHPAPILAVDLLRRPVFALSAATAVCAFATQALAFVSLPFMLQQVLGYTQVETGFLITPWPVVVAVMALIAGRMSDHYPAGLLGGAGLAVLALGMLSLATMSAQPTAWDIGWRMALCGAGFGFFQSPNLRAIIGAAPPGRAGGASGMVGTVRLLGQSSGAALVAACLHLAGVGGTAWALWLGVLFAALASIASFARLRFAD